MIEKIDFARKYIPSVGIETPMTPEFYETFLREKSQIFDIGVDLINCAELHLNPNNIENYEGEYMYLSRLGYFSPIFSRGLTLMSMKTASEEKWPVLVQTVQNTLNLRGT